MRIAALYDIHGNLPALEAVLQEVERERVAKVVVGGDVVPGPLSAECLRRLLQLPLEVRFLQGNGEVDLLAIHRGEVPERVPEPQRKVLEWALSRVPEDLLQEMASWPPVQRLSLPGRGTVLFCHGTPRSENEIFTERTPEEGLRSVFHDVDASMVVCGHTHMQFDRRVGPVRVVNAGSVGLPFDGVDACWLLLDGDGVRFRHTPYDRAGAALSFAEAGFPDPPGFRIDPPPDRNAMLERLESVALSAGPGGESTGSPRTPADPPGTIQVQAVVERKRPGLPRFVVIPGESVAPWGVDGTTPVEVTAGETHLGRRNLKRWGSGRDVWFFDLTSGQCRAARIDTGDRVDLRIRRADDRLPVELQDLLDTDPEAKRRWDALTDAGRRGLADHVRDARRSETRSRRARRRLLGG